MMSVYLSVLLGTTPSRAVAEDHPSDEAELSTGVHSENVRLTRDRRRVGGAVKPHDLFRFLITYLNNMSEIQDRA